MQEKCLRVMDISIQTRFLIRQLSEGHYATADTYADNLARLKLACTGLAPLIGDPVFLHWLTANHPLVCSEIVLTGRHRQPSRLAGRHAGEPARAGLTD